MLLILFTILIIAVSLRTPVDSTIMRMSGTMYQQIDSVTISNVYNAKVINKTHENKHLRFELLSHKNGSIQMVGTSDLLPDNGTLESILIIKLKTVDILGKSTDISLGIYEGEILLETTNINFIGPR